MTTNSERIEAEIAVGTIKEAQHKRLVEAARSALEACRLIAAVGDCMAMRTIHDDGTMREILEQHGFASVQLMAKAAEDKARAALKAKEEA